MGNELVNVFLYVLAFIELLFQNVQDLNSYLSLFNIRR